MPRPIVPIRLSADDVTRALDEWADRAAFDLGPNDSAWNPASTKHVIVGPALVTYHRFPDGGITAVVHER